MTLDYRSLPGHSNEQNVWRMWQLTTGVCLIVLTNKCMWRTRHFTVGIYFIIVTNKCMIYVALDDRSPADTQLWNNLDLMLFHSCTPAGRSLPDISNKYMKQLRKNRRRITANSECEYQNGCGSLIRLLLSCQQVRSSKQYRFIQTSKCVVQFRPFGWYGNLFVFT